MLFAIRKLLSFPLLKISAPIFQVPTLNFKNDRLKSLFQIQKYGPLITSRAGASLNMLLDFFSERLLVHRSHEAIYDLPIFK